MKAFLTICVMLMSANALADALVVNIEGPDGNPLSGFDTKLMIGAMIVKLGPGPQNSGQIVVDLSQLDQQHSTFATLQITKPYYRSEYRVMSTDEMRKVSPLTIQMMPMQGEMALNEAELTELDRQRSQYGRTIYQGQYSFGPDDSNNDYLNRNLRNELQRHILTHLQLFGTDPITQHVECAEMPLSKKDITYERLRAYGSRLNGVAMARGDVSVSQSTNTLLINSEMIGVDSFRGYVPAVVYIRDKVRFGSLMSHRLAEKLNWLWQSSATIALAAHEARLAREGNDLSTLRRVRGLLIKERAQVPVEDGRSLVMQINDLVQSIDRELNK